MILTNEILEQGKSRKGGWSAKQLSALGIDIRFNSGWRKRAIGTDLPGEQIALFLMLKDKHLKKDADQILMFDEDSKAEQNQWPGGNKYNCQTCYHNKVGGCIDAADNQACGYWYDPNSTAKGIRYANTI
mgnify:CR=1 FL=1